MIERGIVVPHGIQPYGNDGIEAGGDTFSPDKLRYYFLYWDKIAYVNSNIIYVEINDEAKKLANAGIIKEVIETVDFSKGFNINWESVSSIHAEAARKLAEKNPGQWVFHQMGDSLQLPDANAAILNTAEISLYNCLPVPPSTVTLDQISDFKHNRQSELLALRGSLDALYIEISKSGDIPRSNIVAIQQLKNALEDLNRASAEAWHSKYFADFNVSIDLGLDNFKQGMTSGALIAASTGSFTFGILGGVLQTAASAIKLNAQATKQPAGISGNQIDLSYVSKLKESKLV